MLVQFKLRNYKAFKEEIKLSLVPSNYFSEREEENILEMPQFRLRLLKSAVIYGANASGKSKLVEAMSFMKNFIIASSKDMQKGDLINIQPFRLSTESEHAPTEFEVIFIHRGEIFRYGFEVTTEKVVSEWLYHREKTKEVELFYREGQSFDLHRSFKTGDTLVKGNLIRENALLLSVAAQFNDTKAGKILDWLLGFNLLSGLSEDGYQGFTMNLTQSPAIKSEILEMIRHADLGIEDMEVESFDPEKAPKDRPIELRNMIEKAIKDGNKSFFTDVITIHKKYDGAHNHVSNEFFSMEREESSGTRKFYALTGPILETLKNGGILVVDELDSRLHPNLVCKLVEIFNSTMYNPHNAQLIFNTHDTNLLSSGTFRRDQIWFTEKNRYGAATLYSLAEFKTPVRKEDNFERNYIQGKYGAIPFLSDFNLLFNPKSDPLHGKEG